MRATFWSFWSQQDKQSGKFLPTCSSVKTYIYLAQRLSRELGWDCKLVTPLQLPAYSSVFDGVPTVETQMPVENELRRLHWDAGFIRHIAHNSDLVVTSNDFIPIPLRQFSSKLRIVSEVSVLPGTASKGDQELFRLAWNSCDALHCNNELTRQAVQAHPRRWKWQFSYPAELLNKPRRHWHEREHRAVFNARLSATGYSHHTEVMEQVPDILVCDPTNYLGKRTGDQSRVDYLFDLLNSKVVVCVTEGGGSTHALREAVAMGCLPVTTRSPEYTELLTERWPYYCRLDSIGSAVHFAHRSGWRCVPAEVKQRIAERLRECTYESAYETAKTNLQELMRAHTST